MSRALEKRPQLYLFNAPTDLLVIAGGLTFVLFPLGMAISPELSVTTFLLLLFVCNYPHYMATNYRIYRSRSQIERYKIFSVYVTGLLGLTALLGHLMADVWVTILYTIYFTWSPFHYTGQNYGISLMYMRRAGTEPSAAERWLLWAAFMCCFGMYVLGINADVTGAGFPFVPLGIPQALVRVAYVALLGVALVCAGWFLARVAARTAGRALLPVLLLMSSQFAWFAAAVGVPLFGDDIGLAWLPIGALFPTIAFLHCAQYLGVTAYYAKRDDLSEQRSFSFVRYFSVLVIGGVFLWIGSTRLLSQALSLDYGISFLIMLSLINIHHFILDGAIWKLRDGRIARLLITPDDAFRRERKQSPTTEVRAPWWRAPAWAAVAVAALALAGTDVFYRLGIQQANDISRTGDAAAAVSLYGSVWRWNSRSSEALDGLAFWDLRSGRVREAAERWERSIQLNPTETSAYAHMGLGEAYLRLGRLDEAMRHLERAIELRPDEPSSYILMGRAYASRGEMAKAEEMQMLAAETSPQQVRRGAFSNFY